MINYLKIFRPINLAIIVATILVVWFSEVPKHFLTPPPLSILFIVLVIATFIAAAGNLHNDYEDQQVDKINKPSKTFPYSKTSFWLLFLLLNSVSILLGFAIFTLLHFAIYTLLPIFLLYVYNKYLQKIAIIGNITVAFLSSLILILAANISGALNTNIHFADYINLLILSSFLISLSRELIKDCIDIKGDKENNYKTLPIITSLNTTILPANLIVIINFYLIYLFIHNDTLTNRTFPFILLTLLILLLTSISFLLSSKYKYKLTLSSILLKLSMVLALITLPFI